MGNKQLSLREGHVTAVLVGTNHNQVPGGIVYHIV
jgi:hypothetical protein